MPSRRDQASASKREVLNLTTAHELTWTSCGREPGSCFKLEHLDLGIKRMRVSVTVCRNQTPRRRAIVISTRHVCCLRSPHKAAPPRTHASSPHAFRVWWPRETDNTSTTCVIIVLWPVPVPALLSGQRGVCVTTIRCHPLIPLLPSPPLPSLGSPLNLGDAPNLQHPFHFQPILHLSSTNNHDRGQVHWPRARHLFLGSYRVRFAKVWCGALRSEGRASKRASAFHPFSSGPSLRGMNKC